MGRSAKLLERRGSTETSRNRNAAFRQKGGERTSQMVGKVVGGAKAWKPTWSSSVKAEYSWRAKTTEGET